MSRKKKTNFGQYAYFLIPMVFLAFYVCLAWAVRLDLINSVGTSEFFGIPAPHSGRYYSISAQRLEYLPHKPEEVEQLFEEAIIRSPADSGIFFDAFRHYKERNCCEDRAAMLLEEALKRSPSSLKMYPEAASYFVKIGKVNKAIEYFQIATSKEPGMVNEMFPLLVAAKLTPEQIARTVIRNKEGLVVLSSYLTKIGISQKEEWLRTVQELHSLEVDPKLLLLTTEQAMKLKDYAVARKYAELARNNSATKKAAENMLLKITRIYQTSKQE